MQRCAHENWLRGRTLATHVAPLTTTRSKRGVRTWAWASLAFFVLVVLGGAVVRTTGSGAGCGDHWPLCNGEFVPTHPRLTTLIEFTHRSSTGVSVMLFLVMIVWTFVATTRKHPARRAAVVSAVLLVVEALLGAALVLRHDVENNVSAERVVMQSIHFTTTMLLLAAVTLTVFFLRESGVMAADDSRTRRAARATIGLILLAGVTGALAALADTLFPYGTLRAALHADFAADAPLLIRMRWLHPAASTMVTAATVAWCWALVRCGRVRAAQMLGWALVAQIVVGVADVLLLAPTAAQLLHLLSADVFWIAVVIVAAPTIFARANAALNTAALTS